MTEFILSLFSSSDKLRASSLYQLLKVGSVLPRYYFWLFQRLLVVHGCFPLLEQATFDKQIQQMVDEGLLKWEEQRVSIDGKRENGKKEKNPHRTTLR